MKRWLSLFGLVVLTIVFAVSITKCGCDGGNGAIPGEPTLTFTPIKTFHFSWVDVSDTTHYKLLENPDGVSGFTQVGSDIPQGTQVYKHVVPLYARINAQYILQNCNASGCNDSSTISVSGTLVDSIGYIKASNTDAGDWFGFSVSLSAEGNTLAVGAIDEDSSSGGVDGNQDDNSAALSGAVYVFSRSGTTWAQQAYIKASNPDNLDGFGHDVSLSSDANTLAVGARDEASSAVGIDGDQADNSAGSAGAVYVFSHSSGIWQQQAYIKASNTDANDFFYKVSLSADGNTLAVGADGEDSNSPGVDGDQGDNSALDSGAVYVFSRSGTTWIQQAYLKASNPGGYQAGDSYFGDGFSLVSLAADGNTLAVGASNEGNDEGAVYVFNRIDTTWSQQAYLKASNADQRIEWADGDSFGNVSLSADGNTLAVGAYGEDSNATGIDGDQNNNWADYAGAVYIFSRSGTTWIQQAYIKASNTDDYDFFGRVNLSADGNTLAVGARAEASSAVGVDGDQADNSANNAGAVYLY